MDGVTWLEGATLALALAGTAAILAASGSRDSRRCRSAVLRLVSGYVR